MRYLAIVKADEQSEAGVMPPVELFEKMGAFNTEMVEAGVMLAAEGLTPSKEGVRLAFTEERPSVINGPFAETKELIAGFWLIQAGSMEEAVAWISRAPFGPGAVVEIRRVAEFADFGDIPQELIDGERALRERASEAGR